MTIIISKKSNTVKENNGHAAITRRRKRYLVHICIVVSIIVLVVLFISGSNSSSTSTTTTTTIDKWNTILSKITSSKQQQQRRVVQQKQQQQKQRHTDDEVESNKQQQQQQQESVYEKEGDVIPEGIRTGYLHLIDVQIEKNTHNNQNNNIQVYGTFCRLDWTIHKNTPSKYPMYRDIIQYSKDNSICIDTTIHNIPLLPLYNDLQKLDISITQYQNNNNNTSNKSGAIQMNIGGIVFHESRCGSTLICNLLVASNPTLHRVYSESSPPLQLLSLCGEHYSSDCTIDVASQLFKKTLYIMSRRMIQYKSIGDEEEITDYDTTQLLEQETTVFFKIQSIGSRYIQTFLHAYPPVTNSNNNNDNSIDTTNKFVQTSIPWIFVYRHPIHVMMSHLKYGANHANCYRNYNNPPISVQAIFTKYNNNTLLQKKVVDNANSNNIRIRNNNNKQLRNHNHNNRFLQLPYYQQQVEYYCAAHLASITESIVTNYYYDKTNNITNGGIVINYSTLPSIFYSSTDSSILQNHFHITITSESIERMKLTSTQYSKGRNEEKAITFTTDNIQKENMATLNVKDAVSYYLQNSYNLLEQLATITGTTTIATTSTTSTTTIQ